MAVAVRGCPAKSPVKGHLVQGMMRFPDALQVLLYSIETKCLVHRSGEIKVRESKMCVLVRESSIPILMGGHVYGANMPMKLLGSPERASYLAPRKGPLLIPMLQPGPCPLLDGHCSELQNNCSSDVSAA